MARGRLLTTWLVCVLAGLPVSGCRQDDVIVALIQPLDGGSGGSAGSSGGAAGVGGSGGSGGTGGQAGEQADACSLPYLYEEFSYVGANNCRVPESQHGTLDRIASFLLTITVPPADGEARPPEPCDFGGPFFYADPDDPQQYVLCDRFCERVKSIAAAAFEEYQACLERRSAGTTP